VDAQPSHPWAMHWVTDRATDWVPTLALPGTEQKLRVMQARALRGQPVFHPLDAQPDEMDATTPVYEIPKPARHRRNGSDQVANHFAMRLSPALAAELARLEALEREEKAHAQGAQSKRAACS